MGQHGSLASDEDVRGASKAGFRGALVGAATWGIYTGILGAGAYFFSPMYRGLTVQFKVFLQMSGMTAGSVIEADKRMREYERRARRMRKLRRDHEVWTRYEKDFEDEDMGRTMDTAGQKE